ncbi:MAG: MraY family glycosyltransferase [Candidatus Micrarchaeia archaeon]
MISLLFVLGFIVSFAATYFVVPYFIRFFGGIELWATDAQKKDKRRVPLGGGVPVLFGFLLGLFYLVAVDTFVAKLGFNTTLLFAALLSMVLITFVGFFDDLNVRRQRREIGSDAVDYKVGLKQWHKPLLTLFAAIPLMVIGTGVSSIYLPFFGYLNLGLLYPLILVPLAVVCVSNATNMLAGLNGLEAGTSAVALLALGGYLALLGRFEAAAIAFCVFVALLAFLRYNWVPAKIFPGDSLTYFNGAAIVSVVIVGNIEKFGAIIFIPWIIEAFLKLRGRFKVRSFGNLQADGTLKEPYEKIYSLTHAAMRLPRWLGRSKRFTEKQVVAVLIGLEALICIFAFALVLLNIV